MIDPKIITFHTLYETMNYHETAARLNMTQPAVTQHIKALENEYKCRLFQYDHRSLHATAAADCLESYAVSAIYNESVLKNKLHKKPIWEYRIGATKSIGKYMIGGQTARFLQNAGRTAEITVDNTETLLHMLDNNQLDFAIIEGEFSKTKYGFQLFRKEAMTGICAKKHPFAGRAVQPEELTSQTLILREHGSGTRNLFEHILQSFGKTADDFSRVVTVNDFSLLCKLVALNTGISFAYESVAAGERDVASFSICGVDSVHELNFVYLPQTDAPALIEKFLSDGQ